MKKLTIFAVIAVLLTLLLCMTDSSFVCDSAHNRYQCKNEECITLTQRCDFRVDCHDKTDEKDCEHLACDNSTQFTCANGKCIYTQWTCDGSDDCYDGSDETTQLCAGHRCSDDEFRCRGSKKCSPKSFKCDGQIDCDEGDDEEGCKMVKVECDEGEIKCADGSACVYAEDRCDGYKDCEDNSDETGCANAVCIDGEFACSSGDQCVSETSRCDGMNECKDGSDEEACEDRIHEKCLDNYFACTSTSRCLPVSWKCDGITQCPDGSDELHCDNIVSRCPDGERLCANLRQCIEKRKFCDGYRDCIDKSDEAECPDDTPIVDCPHHTHYKCPGENGKCISEMKLCDSVDDCPQGEDERRGPHFCDYNECSNFNGNCSHECIDRRLGYECSCRPGFKLMDDGLACEDINECNKDLTTYPCDHFCFNTEGSYKCSCWEHYTLVKGKHCKASTAENKVTLIVADRFKIENVTINRDRHFHVLLRNIYVKSVAVDIQQKYFYWADTKNEKISRAPLSDPKLSEVIHDKSVVRSPHRLAIDWIHGLLFWVDVAYETVSVSYLNGTYPKTLYRTETPAISLAVHPTFGYVYLGYQTPGRGSGKIERCGMDGDKSSCIDIVTQEIAYPIDIAIDYDIDLLYWIDGLYNLLVVSDLDGSRRRNVEIKTHAPLSIAVFSGRVYFTDVRNRQLVSTNRIGGDMKIIKEKLSTETDIAVLNKQEQREADGDDHCANISCNWLCLPKSGAREQACLCPDHYTMQKASDGSTDCIPTTTSSTAATGTSTKKAITTTATRSTDNPKTSSTSTKKATTTTMSTDNPITTTTSTDMTGTGEAPVEDAASGLQASAKIILIIGVIALVVLVAVLLWLVARWRRQRSAGRSMNFNNPIYRKVNESTASSSSIQGLTDPSPSTSAGDISTGGTVEPTASLVEYEEIPDGSNSDLQATAPGLKFTSEGRYAEVPNGDTEVVYLGNNIDHR